MNDSNEILFNIKYIKIKSRISKVYAFFHKKKVHYYLITHSFANVLYLSICMLANFSCFYFRLLTFFKIKWDFFTNKPPVTTIRVSNSLDPDQDPHSGFKVFAEGYLADDKILRWHAKS